LVIPTLPDPKSFVGRVHGRARDIKGNEGGKRREQHHSTHGQPPPFAVAAVLWCPSSGTSPWPPLWLLQQRAVRVHGEGGEMRGLGDEGGTCRGVDGEARVGQDGDQVGVYEHHHDTELQFPQSINEPRPTITRSLRIRTGARSLSLPQLCTPWLLDWYRRSRRSVLYRSSIVPALQNARAEIRRNPRDLLEFDTESASLGEADILHGLHAYVSDEVTMT
jgi:hypothetical protein